SYAYDMETLKKGMHRLENYLHQHYPDQMTTQTIKIVWKTFIPEVKFMRVTIPHNNTIGLNVSSVCANLRFTLANREHSL
ncbi:hypothetical protein ACSBQ8_14540, partial [Staphylococcus equorum]|uniref:hypothetical protein n=1 Tax=Staphylococcus equorum TaxID=246432 RepID=UPI003EBF1ECD